MHNGFSPGGSVSATQLDPHNYPTASSALISISRNSEMKVTTLSSSSGIQAAWNWLNHVHLESWP